VSKELEKTQGVDMILYSLFPTLKAINRRHLCMMKDQYDQCVRYKKYRI
jgi:hypothetical protein